MGCGSSKISKQIVTHNLVKAPKSKSSASSKSSSSSSSSSSHKKSKKIKRNDSTLLTKDNYATKTTAPTPNPTHEITISIEILHNYIELEKTIRTLENRNISSQHTSAKEELDAVCKHIDQVNSSPPTPGTEDYDTALENHQKILLSLHGQKMHLEGQINSLVTKLQTLQSSMDRRDDMLEGLFGGCYGSSLEDQLEEEFIKAANKLGHVRAFYQHWKAAIVYTQKAFEQISTGYHFWQKSFPKNFTGPDGSNLELMIANGQVVPEQIANVTNARSWFIASSTNLGTAVRICIETLKVNIPYCQPNEIETLNKAIHHIFIDAKTADRHLHAGKVYYSMGTRAGGLYKWLETVLSNNISVDLKNAENYHVNCREALTNERHRLIRAQVEEQLGKEALTKFDADIEKAREEANVEDDEDRHSTAFAQITEVDKTKDDAHPANLAGTGSQDDNQSVIERIPINASELPPAPTRAQIYGHMFALMEDAEEAEDKLKQIEDEGRKKQNQLLKEKLANRRRRKLE